MNPTELAQSLDSELLVHIKYRMKFRTLDRTFTLAIIENPLRLSCFVTSDLSNSWHELIIYDSSILRIGPEHFSALMVSLYIKNCYEGVFNCEADEHFHRLLSTSGPTEKVELEYSLIE
jgi:hypothetical protein